MTLANPPLLVPSLFLLSGGLDSSANLAIFIQGINKNKESLSREILKKSICLTVDYGQNAATPEISSARKLAEHYQIPWKQVSLPWLGRLGGSSLTDQNFSVPNPLRTQLDDLNIIQKTARSVWVPNRNGILIETAGAFADRLEIEQIIVGFNAEEAVTFPDNSAEYLNAIETALKYSTKNQVKIRCFTVHLSKKQIIEKLRTEVRDFPFKLLWPCYRAESSWCGKCESCMRFYRAYESAEGEGSLLRL